MLLSSISSSLDERVTTIIILDPDLLLFLLPLYLDEEFDDEDDEDEEDDDEEDDDLDDNFDDDENVCCDDCVVSSKLISSGTLRLLLGLLILRVTTNRMTTQAHTIHSATTMTIMFFALNPVSENVSFARGSNASLGYSNTAQKSCSFSLLILQDNFPSHKTVIFTVSNREYVTVIVYEYSISSNVEPSTTTKYSS